MSFQFLKNFDFYASPVEIQHKGTNSSSKTGAFVSLFLLAFTFLILKDSIAQFFSLENYSYYTQTQLMVPEPVIELNQSDVSMAVYIQNGGRNQSIKPFIVRFKEQQIKLIGQKYIPIKEKYYDAVECKKQRMKKLYGDKFAEGMQAYLYNKLYCSPPQLNVTMYGRYSSNYSVTMVLILPNKTEECQRIQECANADPGDVYLFYPTYKYDPLKKNYKEFYIHDDFYFTLKKGGIKALELYFSQIVFDDSNVHVWPSADIFKNQANISRSITLDRYYNTDLLWEGNTIVEITFRKSAKTITYVRRIDKIDEFMSYLGGLLSIVFILGQIIILPYNQFLLHLELAKNLTFNDPFSPNVQHKTDFSKTTNLLTFMKYQLMLIIKRETQWTNQVRSARQVVQYWTSIESVIERLHTVQAILERYFGQQIYILAEAFKKDQSIDRYECGQEYRSLLEIQRNQLSQDQEQRLQDYQYRKDNMQFKFKHVFQNPIKKYTQIIEFQDNRHAEFSSQVITPS